MAVTVFFLLVTAGVSDAVRPEAAHVVRSLHNQGIACYMITGDEATTAHVSNTSQQI